MYGTIILHISKVQSIVRVYNAEKVSYPTSIVKTNIKSCTKLRGLKIKLNTVQVVEISSERHIPCDLFSKWLIWLIQNPVQKFHVWHFRLRNQKFAAWEWGLHSRRNKELSSFVRQLGYPSLPSIDKISKLYFVCFRWKLFAWKSK